MECEEIRLDASRPDATERARNARTMELLFCFNHEMPGTEKSLAALDELFAGNLGEGSLVVPPLQGTRFHNVRIGKNVLINSNLLIMGLGGVEIEDNVQIAANVQLIANNHDLYERQVITGKPVRIECGAWIGAGATILPGVRVGKYAVVGAASVVTHDVEDCQVVAGNPARVIRTLDAERFAK